MKNAIGMLLHLNDWLDR